MKGSQVDMQGLHELSNKSSIMTKQSASGPVWSLGHISSLNSNRDRPLPIGKLVYEFTVVAEQLGQIIVDELHLPIEKKTIAPVTLGGVAGRRALHYFL